VVARAINMPVYQEVMAGMPQSAGTTGRSSCGSAGGGGFDNVGSDAGALALARTHLATDQLRLCAFQAFALGTLIVLVLMPVFSWFLADPFRIQRSMDLTLAWSLSYCSWSYAG